MNTDKQMAVITVIIRVTVMIHIQLTLTTQVEPSHLCLYLYCSGTSMLIECFLDKDKCKWFAPETSEGVGKLTLKTSAPYSFVQFDGGPSSHGRQLDLLFLNVLAKYFMQMLIEWYIMSSVLHDLNSA